MVTLFIVILVGTWMAILACYAAPLRRLWREPVLRFPVLVIESDDWGAGDMSQALALRRLRELLLSVRDGTGRPAVMTLAVVLAIADRLAMAADGLAMYRRADLRNVRYADIVNAMKEGIAANVFIPQLHGMEHYWPAALMRSAANNTRVRQWLGDDTVPTESLPDALQSRWIDASTLPSSPLAMDDISSAVAEEVRVYREVFRTPPRVAVPTTFVWTEAVEEILAAQGVRFLVTPGRRYSARDAAGRLCAEPGCLLNGDTGKGGITYLVRDVYYEPKRGHQPADLVENVRRQTRLGRPSLIETHRDNFVNGDEQAFASMKAALTEVLAALPQLRFMSTEELGAAIKNRDSVIIEHRPAQRIGSWITRAYALPRFRKIAGLSGMLLVSEAARLFCARLKYA